MKIRVMLVLAASVAAVGLGQSAAAQQSAAADSALYSKAQSMVANGQAAAGRKLADSLAATATPGTPAFAEGLYWRATLAASARDAENDYRQIVVDYPLSPRVPEALLRLGQLESARGDRDAALQHFQRVGLEHPESPLRAEASYWVAKTYFDKNDAIHACAANTDAQQRVNAADVELKNRIDFQQQRCRGIANAVIAQNTPPARPARATPSTSPAVTTPTVRETPATPREIPVKSDSAAVTTAPTPRAADSSRDMRLRAAAEARTESGATAERPRTKPTATASASRAESTVTKTTTATTVTSSGSPSHGYAVQVAAFKAKGPADDLAAKLRGRGYSVHVDGTAAPYRVRIGTYPTRAEAADELAKLKAKKIDGFVTER